MTEKLVVWYIDWVHAILFEILLTVAATCSAISLIIKMWELRHEE